MFAVLWLRLHSLVLLALLIPRGFCQRSLTGAFGSVSNCNSDQTAMLNQWWNEIIGTKNPDGSTKVQGLNDAALQFLNAVSSSDVNEQDQAKRAAATWLAVTPTNNLNEAIRVFTLVKAFLDSGTSYGGKQSQLFCGSSWLAQQNWDDIAQQVNPGKPSGPTMDIFKPDATGAQQPVTIQSYLGTSANDARKYRPFFGKAINYYVVDYNGDFCTRGLRSGSVAGTQTYWSNYNTMTICSQAFTLENSRAPERSMTLGGEGSPTLPGLRNVDNYASLSLTLYHELFHLVLGSTDDLSVDDSYGAVQTEGLASRGLKNQNTQTRVLKNPESYSYFALAAWWFYNGDPNLYLGSKGAVNRVT